MKNQGVSKILGGSGGGNSLRVTKWFFDAPAVVNAVDAATRKTLSKFGAFVRRTMRSSIRKAKSPSKPGNPPHSHTGLLKQFTFFSFDPTSRSVVIGPERLNAVLTGNVPEVLEYGGTARNRVVTRVNGKKSVTVRTSTIKARPFANPALAKELPKLPEMWRNSVKSKT